MTIAERNVVRFGYKRALKIFDVGLGVDKLQPTMWSRLCRWLCSVTYITWQDVDDDKSYRKQVRQQDAYRQTRGRGAVKTMSNSLAPFSRATSPSRIVCLYLANSKLLKLAAASNACGVWKTRDCRRVSGPSLHGSSVPWTLGRHASIVSYSKLSEILVEKRQFIIPFSFIMYDHPESLRISSKVFKQTTGVSKLLDGAKYSRKVQPFAYGTPTLQRQTTDRRICYDITYTVSQKNCGPELWR